MSRELDPRIESSAFMDFLRRNGGDRTDLAYALQYQAAQARSGSQEITTPQQKAMKAWAAQLADERKARLRELTTLIKD